MRWGGGSVEVLSNPSEPHILKNIYDYAIEQRGLKSENGYEELFKLIV